MTDINASNLLHTKFFDSRYFVGYEPIVKRFNEISQSISRSLPNYPPYNIVKLDENKYVIEIAVAGFGKQHLDVEINDGTLTIMGRIESDQEGGHYLYKGIADRAFSRTFNVSDTVEIKNAQLLNGMLKIWLENIIPDSKKSKKIEIDEPTEESKSEKTFLSEGK